MICLYPEVVCSGKIKEFLKLLDARNIFHTSLLRDERLSLHIYEHDYDEVIELANSFRIDFEGFYDSVIHRNGYSIRVSF